MTMRKTTFLAALLATALALPAMAADAFKVVANSSVSVRALSRHALSDLFMKKSANWEGGAAAAPVDNASAALREEFSRSVHGKAAAAVKSYWNQQIFSGRSLPPLEKPSDADVLAYVKATPGAVGYVSNAADTSGVKVLALE
jgi:ABC-type phosphate transport system substrate-binding protein